MTSGDQCPLLYSPFSASAAKISRQIQRRPSRHGSRGIPIAEDSLQVRLTGDRSLSRRNHPTLPSITERVESIVDSQWRSTSAPTGTNREAYRIASEEFGPVLGNLRQIIETDLPALEQQLEAAGAPWTPGRVPRWSPE